MTTALWWIRRDLRLTDNEALSASLRYAERVIPVFVLDPNILDSAYVGEKRLAFLLAGLRQLDAGLRVLGSRLVLRRGDPAQQLTAIARENEAEAVFAEEDFTPYARAREERVAQALPLHLTGGLVVHPPRAVLKADGTPYTVFTPFSRAWRCLPLPRTSSIIPPPSRLADVGDLDSLSIPVEPSLPRHASFIPGEAEAQGRLGAFVGANHDAPRIYRYAEGRNRLDLDGTSGLSPYLHLGMLSARQAVVSALEAIDAAPDPQARKAAETWLDELIWREFYIAILAHFPHVQQQSFRQELRSIAWENDHAAFSAWCEGRTGYPVVDAAMRQLTETGWMHNRARMIVASFLVKDLLIDWRWGERHFMQSLVDGDEAANNGGWQWTAGTGTDAAPYFRIFSPILQGKKHDPGGAYVRRWVPELVAVPDRYLHTPWKMPIGLQRDVGCILGEDYPEPIVDHAWARERILAAYAHAREASRHAPDPAAVFGLGDEM